MAIVVHKEKRKIKISNRKMENSATTSSIVGTPLAGVLGGGPLSQYHRGVAVTFIMGTSVSLMETRGFEPLTSAVQRRRSSN